VKKLVLFGQRINSGKKSTSTRKLSLSKHTF